MKSSQVKSTLDFWRVMNSHTRISNRRKNNININAFTPFSATIGICLLSSKHGYIVSETNYFYRTINNEHIVFDYRDNRNIYKYFNNYRNPFNKVVSYRFLDHRTETSLSTGENNLYVALNHSPMAFSLLFKTSVSKDIFETDRDFTSHGGLTAISKSFNTDNPLVSRLGIFVSKSIDRKFDFILKMFNVDKPIYTLVSELNNAYLDTLDI